MWDPQLEIVKNENTSNMQSWFHKHLNLHPGPLTLELQPKLRPRLSSLQYIFETTFDIQVPPCQTLHGLCADWLYSPNRQLLPRQDGVQPMRKYQPPVWRFMRPNKNSEPMTDGTGRAEQYRPVGTSWTIIQRQTLLKPHDRENITCRQSAASQYKNYRCHFPLSGIIG